MTPIFPYVFRWNRQGRKDQLCRVLTRSRDRLPRIAPLPGIVNPAPKTFNSILVEFVDGYRMVTSGNAIRKAEPTFSQS